MNAGVVEVTFLEDSQGYLKLVAMPPAVRSDKCVSPPLGDSSPSSGGDTAQSDSDSDGSLGEAPSRFVEESRVLYTEEPSLR